MERVKGKKFIFIDSINTLLIYNQPNTLAKFIHSILTKMRINNVSGLLISLESETNKEVRAEIAQLCDGIIKV
jgi:archaellum biogenesis ATPase FlaH